MALSTGAGAAPPRPFNEYILNAVRSLEASQYSHKGYNRKAAFTHDLPYADQCCVKHSPAAPNGPAAPLTMCVAAVEEVILTALQQYYLESPAAHLAALKTAPLSLWSKGTPVSLRANLFQYDGTGSRGTGDTLARFGMGREKRFGSLQPGDFLNFNRRHSGHAVIFIAYLDGHDAETTVYSPAVTGFKYFSSQGEGKAPPASGLGYRWAYFEDHGCPQGQPGRLRDCGVIRSEKISLLDGGTLYFPEDWKVSASLQLLRAHTRAAIANQQPALRGDMLDRRVDQFLQQELMPPDPGQYREDTTD
jgi:hypothetical protein